MWTIDQIREKALQFWAEAVDIWTSGGWGMIAIAVVAFFMFGIGVQVFFRLRAKAMVSVPESEWRRWIEDPSKRVGAIGELLDFVMEAPDLKTLAIRFEQVRRSELVPFDRDLLVMKVCVGAAPLVGLLGTVTGMLATFAALAEGSGGDKTMDLVASGISEALITTETGLVIALPGLFFQYLLARKQQRYRAFLAHIEVVCTQRMYRRILNETHSNAA